MLKLYLFNYYNVTVCQYLESLVVELYYLYGHVTHDSALTRRFMAGYCIHY